LSVQKKFKKVVILHDWLTGYRGGERVLEALCEMYPEAPIYTLIHKKGSTSPYLESKTIYTSFLNFIPGIAKHYRKFLPLMPLAAERLKLPQDTELVISSSHAVIKGVRIPKGAKHISYIHSPMRYLYDLFEVYFGPTAPWYQRWGIKIFKSYLINWDKNSNQSIDCMIANSKFVQDRIKKAYCCDSRVVYPFVDLKDFQNLSQRPKQKYFLMVTAFAPNKRVDLAIEAFNQLGFKLKIIGSGQQETYLKGLANSNIEFLGNLDRGLVIQHLQETQALVFPGVEDFGITPLEALAAGTPVIAFAEGGVLETLYGDSTDKPVAKFFIKDSVAALVQAVSDFDYQIFESDRLKTRAAQFSKDRFKSEMSMRIDNCM
jgi:glycosyltransferase involved in cell wall biosynthesis